MLSDIGSLASILGLILSFGAGFGVCKIFSKKNVQSNTSSSLLNIGDTNQSNDNKQ